MHTDEVRQAALSEHPWEQTHMIRSEVPKARKCATSSRCERDTMPALQQALGEHQEIRRTA
jgi:hypothetical protein